MGEQDEKPLVADPCPWCGKADIRVLATEEYRDNKKVKVFWLYCRLCKGSGPFGSNPEEAVERWNKRILVVE